MPPRQRINLQLLAHLDALVTERHVTRAAEKMGIGQPAMSGALARLRATFGDPILVKTGAGMEPTIRALALARQLNEALALIEEAATATEVFDPMSASVTFKIMASDGLAQLFLPRLMSDMRRRAPHMKFTVVPGDNRRVLELLRDGEFDLILCHVHEPPENLYQMRIYPQRLVCIAAKNHPVIRGKLSIRQFTEAGHVVWGAPPVPFPTIEASVDYALAQRKLARDVVIRVSNIQLSTAVVATTDLLAVVPERIALIPSVKRQLQILPLPFPLEHADVSMYWHERRHRDPAHAWLRVAFKTIADSIREAD